MTDLFAFEQVGYENHRVIGRLRPTGLRPRFMEKIEAAGINLSPAVFGIGDRRR
jgi:pilus assembly protein CpaF